MFSQSAGNWRVDDLRIRREKLGLKLFQESVPLLLKENRIGLRFSLSLRYWNRPRNARRDSLLAIASGALVEASRIVETTVGAR
jgi:hypothetical protein